MSGRRAISSRSLKLRRVTEPASSATAPRRWDPARTRRRLDPIEARRWRMDSRAPPPRASIAITAATPMRIPSIERAERIGCVRIARSAWRRWSAMTAPSPGACRSPGASSGSARSGRPVPRTRSSETTAPSRILMILAAWAAISASCVTTTIVFPSRLSRSSTAMISASLAVSRFPVGSSARRIGGSLTSARAIATRCCSPPESSDGRWTARAARPTSRRRSCADSRRWRLPA